MSRFQVHFRRRRQCLTDYQQRSRLLTQSKDTYNAPKYRLVVRKTNTKIICQVVRSEICGDHVVCVAYSSELDRYGVKVGHKNYASAYCTGLLVARRLLAKIGTQQKKDLVGKFQGTTNVGEFIQNVERNGAEKQDDALTCYLDIGINRSTTGAVVFGALKGAADGGLFIPYSGHRLAAGYWDKKEDAPANEAALKDRIYGKHIADYLESLNKHPEKKSVGGVKLFSQYEKNGVKPGDIEAMYKKAHDEIRKNPAPSGKKPEIKNEWKTHNGDKDFRKRYNKRRNESVEARKAAKLATEIRKARLTGKGIILSQLKK